MQNVKIWSKNTFFVTFCIRYTSKQKKINIFDINQDRRCFYMLYMTFLKPLKRIWKIEYFINLFKTSSIFTVNLQSLYILYLNANYFIRKIIKNRYFFVIHMMKMIEAIIQYFKTKHMPISTYFMNFRVICWGIIWDTFLHKNLHNFSIFVILKKMKYISSSKPNLDIYNIFVFILVFCETF